MFAGDFASLNSAAELQQNLVGFNTQSLLSGQWPNHVSLASINQSQV